ncbi:lysosomal alpha-mannosidase-like [Daktulosphaira vitifoliae]|uniref:lysosomal alpha-mannosidase-like n=1 Tax=Daktulosphaira vitifoliae TaxID=58002 RepID=UPI0021A9E31A|nr:lysosomal alpha-mannosidase-like [Daktulosphaira vitifoliae]
MKIFILLTLISSNVLAGPCRNTNAKKCGYESCHPVKIDYLNVHFVPHSHDDVGWLKTVDQYYYGTNNSIQAASVQFILDSVVEALSKDSNRRFIYVETAFFWKWWEKQNENIKMQVRYLVSSGQLEFIGGAWSMNDEANANYISIIDQFTWGLRKLNDTFGACGRPHIGWQIDPFGHTKQMASLFTQLGFDGLFFGRLDVEEKSQRLKNKTAEMIWKSSPNLGQSADLFTHALYNRYSSPNGYCFDVLCESDPIIDDKESPEYNVKQKGETLIDYIHKQSLQYKTNNIILTMGDDFHYTAAGINFHSMDKIINYINSKQSSGSKINAIYSTPSCYLKAVNDRNETFTTKSDDFLPYKSDKHTYWTGYFTSRPTQKYFERKGNNILQVCKQLAVTSLEGHKYEPKINPLREAMGVMQHHDAITGTAKQHVANDYARILSEAITECEDVSSMLLQRYDSSSTKYETCNLLNISACTISEQSEQFILTLYNPLSRPITEFVRLPIMDNNKYIVLDPQGKNIITQIVPIPQSVLNIPGRESLATSELVFEANDLPPLGYKSYHINKDRNSNKKRRTHTTPTQPQIDSVDLGDTRFGLKINNIDSRQFTMHISGLEVPLQHEFFYYKSMNGDNKKDYKRASGAYIFRPNGTAVPICDHHNESKIFKGPVVQEIHIICSNWTSQVIRKYKGDDHLEFEWLVGPIPDEDNIGKEVISRFKIPSYKNDKTFYTDSNGREFIKRVLNYRSSFDLKENVENISGNYYPITSQIMLTDGKTQFAILNDRAQGGSSLDDGEIELMVHRRMFLDDAFGVGEALNETSYGTGLVVRGQHYLTFGTIDKQFSVQRLLAQRKLLRPQYFLSKKDSVVKQNELLKEITMQYSSMRNSLPKNVQLLTLEPWKENTILLRLEHIFEYNEDKNLSKPVTLNLEDLFTNFRITSLHETTLGANQWLSENSRLSWKTDDEDTLNSHNIENTDQVSVNPKQVALTPMQIRTFVAEIKTTQSVK